jgi:hypothetical protein
MKLVLNNAALAAQWGKSPGDALEVLDNGRGVPLAQYWRARVRDAAQDNCVSVVTEESSLPPKKPTTKKGDS